MLSMLRATLAPVILGGGRTRVLVAVPVAVVVLLAGCVPYRASVLSPPALENSFRARTLHDPGLIEFLRTNQLGTENWPPSQLNVRSLALVGYYFSPELGVTRAGLTAAETAVRAAGVRPSPSLAVEAGYNRNPESPATYSVLPTFIIETAGQARIASSSGATAG